MQKNSKFETLNPKQIRSYKLKKIIMGIVVSMVIVSANTVLAAPATTAPVPGTTLAPATTTSVATSNSCPLGASTLAERPATEDKFGTIKSDDLSKLPLNERIRCDPTIKTMWKQMLNLADVLVTLFFLAVAFATILHINYDTYGVKKALPPLLIGIVLAHFSLPIVYSIVDFAQIMSAGFYNSASSGMGAQGLADNIAAAIFSGGLTKVGGTTTAITFGVAFGMITFLGVASGGTLIPIIFLAAVVLFILAATIPSILIVILSFLLYARFYIILFLTIVAPLAWLTQAWGPVQGFFKKWWSQFMMWTFMAPVVVFFLWIAIAFSQASMKGGVVNGVQVAGTANFGTYVITLVMFYLAITTPFKMGGQIMNAWGGLGKKASALGYKGANVAGGAGLDRLSRVKVGNKRLADWGVMSGAAMKAGIKARFEEPAKMNRELATAAARRMDLRSVIAAPGRNWQQRQRQRWEDKQRSWAGPSVIENDARLANQTAKLAQDQYGHLDPHAKGEAIRNDGGMTEELAQALILQMARNGERIEHALQNYNNRFNPNNRPNDRFNERLNGAVRYTRPFDMTNVNPQERQQAIDGWFSRDNIERIARDFAEIRRLSAAENAEAIRRLNEAMAALADPNNPHDYINQATGAHIAYTPENLLAVQQERDRLQNHPNDGEAFATYFNVGSMDITNPDGTTSRNDLSAGNMRDVLSRVDRNMHNILVNRGAAAAITNITDQIT